MKRTSVVLLGLAGCVALAMSCQATQDGSVFGDESGEGGGWGGTASSAGQGGTTSSGQDVGIFVGAGGSTGEGGSDATCVTSAGVDDDGDGASEDQGDCNDCDKNVGPGAIEVVNSDPMAKPSDEDCDGFVDNVKASTCDDNLELADPDPKNGARAVDLCQFTTPGEMKWGVLDAKYVRANGSATAANLGVGILSDFGPNVNVQGGTRLLALSSGYSRLPSQPNACFSQTCSTTGSGSAPPGFPQDPPNCPVSQNINDDIGLEVKIRSPKNATGYEFNFKFYSFEYPEWVCMNYNDQFIALVNPAPMGSINGNISFDNKKNPVSVNIAFFDVCQGCPLGTGELKDTGFDEWDDAGATAWLKTQAPIVGGDEVTIRFAIWDTGDSAWDSTALVDGFKWIADGGSVTVGTEPIPVPK